MRRTIATILFGLIVVSLLVSEALAVPASPQGPYVVSTFASDNVSGCGADFGATPKCYFNVDSLTNDDNFVYAGYQNTAAADGSSGSSILAKYARAGGAPVQFSPTLPGKTDGLRINPFTHQLWALNNEDAHPVLRIIDPATMSVLQDAPLATNTPFAGGYDDAVFTPDGRAFISASNPGLTKNGTNNYRAIVRADVVNGNVVLTPILPGQVNATDRATGAQVKVNITDPDSLAPVPGTSTFILNDQGDSTVLFVDQPGGGAPNVSAFFLRPDPTVPCGNPPSPPAVPCPPIVDETTFVTSGSGRFLVADHAKPGAIYSLTKVGGFDVGAVYTTVASDNPTLANTLGTLDISTGQITPAVAGFKGPKGLIYLS